MADDGVFVKVVGLDHVRAALAELPDKIRLKAVRGALRKAGQVIQKAAKANAPVLSSPARYRKPGTVRAAISVRVSKASKQEGNEGVFVNVKPAAGAKFKTVTSPNLIGKKTKRRYQVKISRRGTQSPYDPYYWRWLEFGTKKMRARPFLKPAADAVGEQALQKFIDEVVPQIEKFNTKK